MKSAKFAVRNHSAKPGSVDEKVMLNWRYRLRLNRLPHRTRAGTVTLYGVIDWSLLFSNNQRWASRVAREVSAAARKYCVFWRRLRGPREQLFHAIFKLENGFSLNSSSVALTRATHSANSEAYVGPGATNSAQYCWAVNLIPLNDYLGPPIGGRQRLWRQRTHYIRSA